MRNTINFDDALREDLKDPAEAKAYLEVALELYEEDNDTEMFLMALKDVAEAQGGLISLAERTHLNPQSLNRLFSSQETPKLDAMGTILHGLGFQLSLKALPPSDTHVSP